MKNKKHEIRYFVDRTGSMLITIDDKDSIIIDVEDNMTYISDIAAICPSFKRCLTEINKSTLSDEFIGKIMCTASEYEFCLPDNYKNLSRIAYLVVKDLLDNKRKKKTYDEPLPYAIKVSIQERVNKLRDDIDSINKTFDNAVQNGTVAALQEIGTLYNKNNGIHIAHLDENDIDEIKQSIHNAIYQNRSKFLGDQIDKMENELNKLQRFLSTQSFEET